MLEILLPCLFVGVLCLPRLLLPPRFEAPLFFSPVPITDFAWSGVRRRCRPREHAGAHSVPPRPAPRARAPAAAQWTPGGGGAGSGAYRLLYAPNTSSDATLVARLAAASLLCDGAPLSVVRQLAVPAAVTLNAAAVAASAAGGGAAAGVAACARSPLACAGLVTPRPGGLALDSPLLTADLGAACSPACLADPGCVGQLTGLFLGPYATEAEAVAAAGERVGREGGHTLESPASLAFSLFPPLSRSSSLPYVSLSSFNRSPLSDSRAHSSAAARAAADPAGVAAVLLLPADVSGDELSYTVRANASDTPGVAQFGNRWHRFPFQPWVAAPSSEYKKDWLLLNIQRAVDSAIISVKTGAAGAPAAATAATASEALALAAAHAQAQRSPPLLQTSVKSFPTSAYVSDEGGTFAGLLFGLLFVLAFLTTVVLILKSVLVEKELRLKEHLLIAGLRGRTYWLAWFLTHYASLVCVCVLLAGVGSYPFRHSSPELLLCFFLLWTASLVLFCYALAGAFQTSKVACVAGR